MAAKRKQREADFMQVGEEVVPGMRLRCVCRGHTDTIGRIAWSPDGRFIASPSFDKTIRIWDAETGECLAVLEGHEGEVTDVSWSKDGATLATGGHDGSIQIWDVDAKKIVHHFPLARIIHRLKK